MKFEQPLFESETNQKERESDSCLEQIMGYIKDWQKFWESRYWRLLKNNELGFSEEETQKALDNLKTLRENILDLYEKEKENIQSRNHLSHILGNSALMLSGSKAEKFMRKGKIPSEEIMKRIKKDSEMVVYYLKELNNDPTLLKEEIFSEKGYWKDKEKIFEELPTQSEKQLELFKLWRDWEKGKISSADFKNSIQEIEEQMGRKILNRDFLDKQVK